ncbi:MAG: acyl carrier protein [Bacteroidales bacterium]|nr:acyl carrier protein [Bacteroidales bacterium]
MDINEFILKFADAIEVENSDKLTPETPFHDLDEWSSISVMLLIAFIDEEFGKEITMSNIKEAVSIQDLYNFATA